MPKVLNPLASDRASGRFIDRIYYAIKGINFVRKYTEHVFTPTAKQLIIQQNLANLSYNWSNVLTQTQRDFWNNRMYEIRDFWNFNHSINGLPAYQKINNVLISAGKTLQTIPPPDDKLLMPTVTNSNLSNNDYSLIPAITNTIQTYYAPFIEIWIAGKNYGAVISDNQIYLKIDGIKPTRNPNRCNFRRIGFVTENFNYQTILLYRDSEGGLLTGNKRISVIIRRYTKYGIPSMVNRFNMLTITKS